MTRNVLRRIAYILLAVGAAALQAQRRSGPILKEASAKPSLSIPLDQLGFVPPGASLLLQRIAGTTLNFVDSNHLLFTFHQHALLRRAADAQPDDDDQIIHAEIVNIATSKVEAATDWRMHDRDRFLWPLGRGQFLIRQRDTLFRTDASLQLNMYTQFAGKLRSIQLSPDRKVLVAETEESPAKAPRQSPPTSLLPSTAQNSITRPIQTAPNEAATDEPASSQDDSKTGTSESGLPVMVRIINLGTNTLIAQTHTRIYPKIPTIETGFLEETRGKGDHWLVTYMEFKGDSRPVAEVSSLCAPTLQFLSSSVVLIVTCNPSLKDRLLTAVTLDGKLLWDRRTDSHRIWPAITAAEDGSRFAIASLVLDHSISAADPFDAGDVVGQVAEVFDTMGGQSALEAPADPVIDTGQNFALSPDGRKFAILHKSAIEIYELK